MRSAGAEVRQGADNRVPEPPRGRERPTVSTAAVGELLTEFVAHACFASTLTGRAMRSCLAIDASNSPGLVLAASCAMC